MKTETSFSIVLMYFINMKLRKIHSIKQLSEYIDLTNPPALNTIVNKAGLLSIDLTLYLLLLDFYNIELKDEDIKYLSAVICLLFSDFTLADIYYVFVNDKRYFLKRNIKQISKHIIKLFEQHQTKKLMYLHITE